MNVQTIMLFLMVLLTQRAFAAAPLVHLVAEWSEGEVVRRIARTTELGGAAFGAASWRELPQRLPRLPWRGSDDRRSAQLTLRAEASEIPLLLTASGCREEGVGARTLERCAVVARGMRPTDEALRAIDARAEEIVGEGTVLFDAAKGVAIAGWIEMRRLLITELWHATSGATIERARVAAAWARLPEGG